MLRYAVVTPLMRSWYDAVELTETKYCVSGRSPAMVQLDVPVGMTLLFAEALGVVGIARRESVYWAGRTTLVRRPEDVELYDRSFAAWWEHVLELSFASPVEREVVKKSNAAVHAQIVKGVSGLLDALDAPGIPQRHVRRPAFRR